MNMVRFYDADGGQVVSIPESELSSEAILTTVKGIKGEVWTLPSYDKESVFKHPPFCESVRIYIQQIREDFAEHYPLTFEEWENGFRRDENASQQIAAWWYAAGIYRELTNDEPCEHRRADIYKCVLACMTASPDTVWDFYQPDKISHAEAQQIVSRYFIITSLNDPA